MIQLVSTPVAPISAPRRPWYAQLYVQVLAAILVGATLGHLSPATGIDLKPLGDAFIALVRMVIAPVIFLTLVTGIASLRDLGALGRVAAKAFGYFLFFSTLALILGLIVAHLVQPGAGLHIRLSSLDQDAVRGYVQIAQDHGLGGFLLHIIPTTLMSPLDGGDILQTLLVSVLFGIAASLVGEPARPVIAFLEQVSAIVFRLVGMLMRVAPIGAFGAIAFTIGRFGLGSLVHLAALLATFYLTAALFVVLVLGGVSRVCGFSIFRLLRYLRDELLLVLGTSSSEAALPGLIAKMEAAGCDRSVVGVVVPTGYSFNLDGTNIYMTLAALFIAQACDVSLSFGQQAMLLGVAMLSSKGAAGVTGAGFITLAATLSVVPTVPVAGMALILGIDRFMSGCRSLTNFIGNAVATVVVARWEGALDRERFNAAMSGLRPSPLVVHPDPD